MIGLLSPRLLIALALAVGLAFSHFTAYRKGKLDERHVHQAAVAAANEEARSLERARQRRADEAGQLAATREAGIRAAADRAASAAGGLRDALSAANRSREESAAAAAKRAAALGELLAQGADAHRELAETCDRHVSDLRLLLEAWPK